MLENVFIRPAGEIEFGSVGQEIETGLGQFAAPLARQPALQDFTQAMQVKHVGGGIAELIGAEVRGAPIRLLLFFRYVGAQQLGA